MDKKHLIGIFLFIVLLFAIYFTRSRNEHFYQTTSTNHNYYFEETDKDGNVITKARSQNITKYKKSDKGKYSLYKFDLVNSLIYIPLDEADFNIRLYFKITNLDKERTLIDHKNYIIEIDDENKLTFNDLPLATVTLKVDTQHELIVNYPLQIMFFDGIPVAGVGWDRDSDEFSTIQSGEAPEQQLLIGNSLDHKKKFDGYIGGIKINYGTDKDNMITPNLDESDAPTNIWSSLGIDAEDEADVPWTVQSGNEIKYLDIESDDDKDAYPNGEVKKDKKKKIVEDRVQFYKLNNKESAIRIKLLDNHFNIKLFFEVYNTGNKVLFESRLYKVEIKDEQLTMNGRPISVLDEKKIKRFEIYELVINNIGRPYPEILLIPNTGSTESGININTELSINSSNNGGKQMNKELYIGNSNLTNKAFKGYIGGIQISHVEDILPILDKPVISTEQVPTEPVATEPVATEAVAEEEAATEETEVEAVAEEALAEEAVIEYNIDDDPSLKEAGLIRNNAMAISVNDTTSVPISTTIPSIFNNKTPPLIFLATIDKFDKCSNEFNPFETGAEYNSFFNQQQCVLKNRNGIKIAIQCTNIEKSKKIIIMNKAGDNINTKTITNPGGTKSWTSTGIHTFIKGYEGTNTIELHVYFDTSTYYLSSSPLIINV
jgi:hypothetical protein